MAANQYEILRAYRHFYRQLLRTVQFAAPYRYVVRDKLRTTFREAPADAFDRARVARTLEFLQNATSHAGLEHRIIKSLVHMNWGKWKNRQLSMNKVKNSENQVMARAYDPVDEAIENLNDSMGLCLK